MMTASAVMRLERQPGCSSLKVIESLVFFVHIDHVDLLVDGGLGGEFGGDFSHSFAVPDASVDAHELFAVFVNGPHGGKLR